MKKMVSEEMREEIEALAYELWKNGWNERDRDDLRFEYKLTPAEIDAVFELFGEFEEKSGK